MKKYLEKTLRQIVTIKENNDLYDKLPLAFKGRYDILNVETNGMGWLAIQPKNDIGLVALRKDRAKVQNISGLNCAIFLRSTTPYIKEKLIEDGIPFVLKDKQIYLPFIGCLLSNSGERDIAPVELLSFLTQKLILTAIYEKWEKVTVSTAAEKLGVSKTSASRCFDEIEYLNVNILDTKGKSRAITRRYAFPSDIHLEKKAGITALCEYSLLSDNDYPTYGVTKKELADTGIKKLKQVRRGEEIGCIVLELGYFIDYGQKSIQDPLSVALSLTDEEKQDERVMISINEMLEEYVW